MNRGIGNSVITGLSRTLRLFYNSLRHALSFVNLDVQKAFNKFPIKFILNIFPRSNFSKQKISKVFQNMNTPLCGSNRPTISVLFFSSMNSKIQYRIKRHCHTIMACIKYINIKCFIRT